MSFERPARVYYPELFCQTGHMRSLETRELFVPGTAHVDSVSCLSVAVATDGRAVGGIQPNGNFVLTAVTNQTEWISPLNVSVVLSGNRTGQWCSVHMEVTHTGDQPFESGSILFTAIPESFQPHTRVVVPLSVWSGSSFAPATVVFEPASRQVLFYGTLSPGEVLIGTPVYFKAQ